MRTTNVSNRTSNTEIIAFSSGKGGTGKTLMCASLGYALSRAGHDVLLIDADPGTDGLSLFMLGPDGWKETDSFSPSETFRGILMNFRETEKLSFRPHEINRLSDHDVIYHAIISGTGLYGDIDQFAEEQVVPRLERSTYHSALIELFSALRTDGTFDYVLVDTRGGFAFESTEICALADSFILVTEADYTSFYQDRNLVKWIRASVRRLEESGNDHVPVLRSVIVNKATSDEKSFRMELEKEFKIKFSDTHAVPLDIAAIEAYRQQLVPFVTSPGSDFSAATVKAFSRIMRLVTAGWSRERITDWNKLVAHVSEPYAARHRLVDRFIRGIRENAAGLVLAGALGGALVGYSTFQSFQEQRRTALADNAYSLDQPITRRIADFVVLVESGYLLFDGIDLSGWDLSNLELTEVRFRGADLSGSQLVSSVLERGMLVGSNLSNVSAGGANFRFANLSSADLSGAGLQDADLTGADLTGADLRGSNLGGALGIREIASIREANIFGVLDAPTWFLDWATERGAVSLENDADWNQSRPGKN